MASWKRTSGFLVCPMATGPMATAIEPSRPGVPENASAASSQIRKAVQTAIVSGKRRLNVDVLLPAVDVRQRTYDDEAKRQVFLAMIESCVGGGIHVVVGGPSMAARVRSWIATSYDGREEHEITVGLLGTNKGMVEDLSSEDIRTVVVMVNSDRGMRDFMDFRKLLQEVHEYEKTVILFNHPKQNELYELFGYGGVEPIEIGDYEDVYMIAPIAIEKRNGGQGEKPVRFVVMKQFPWRWGLWKDVTHQLNEEKETYILCKEFGWRPDRHEMMENIGQAMSM